MQGCDADVIKIYVIIKDGFGAICVLFFNVMDMDNMMEIGNQYNIT